MASRAPHWDKIADGEIHILHAEDDFHLTTHGLQCNVRQWARTWGYRCETRTMDGGIVIVRLTPTYLREAQRSREAVCDRR